MGVCPVPWQPEKQIKDLYWQGKIHQKEKGLTKLVGFRNGKMEVYFQGESKALMDSTWHSSEADPISKSATWIALTPSARSPSGVLRSISAHWRNAKEQIIFTGVEQESHLPFSVLTGVTRLMDIDLFGEIFPTFNSESRLIPPKVSKEGIAKLSRLCNMGRLPSPLVPQVLREKG